MVEQGKNFNSGLSDLARVWMEIEENRLAKVSLLGERHVGRLRALYYEP